MCCLMCTQDMSPIPPRSQPHMVGKHQRMKRGTVQGESSTSGLRTSERHNPPPCSSSRPRCELISDQPPQFKRPATSCRGSQSMWVFFFFADLARKAIPRLFCRRERQLTCRHRSLGLVVMVLQLVPPDLLFCLFTNLTPPPPTPLCLLRLSD